MVAWEAEAFSVCRGTHDSEVVAGNLSRVKCGEILSVDHRLDDKEFILFASWKKALLQIKKFKFIFLFTKILSLPL